MVTREVRGGAVGVGDDRLDAAAVRGDFPILAQTDRLGRPLAFLDSAASSQRPEAVLAAMDAFHRRDNANIHRGVYDLSERATASYERARRLVAGFLGADERECVFVRNATEAINLVALTWGRRHVGPGDLIVVSLLEHHSNLVPWQMLAEERGAEIAHVGITPDGRLDDASLDALLARAPKLVAVTHVSNAIGTINDAGDIVRRAHAAGATVLVDGAQSVPHLPIDVRALGCDFLVLSGHKMLGPMGIGVLYGKGALLDAMPPLLGGGGMIRSVGLERSTWAEAPAKFEAGTPAVAEAIGLGAAIGYLSDLGMDRVRAHERQITGEALERLADIPGLTLHGPRDPEQRAGVVSFTVAGLPPREVARRLNEENVAVRAGHHCCQPLHEALGVDGTVRASFYVYTVDEDVDRLVDGVRAIAPSGGGGWVVASGESAACRDRWTEVSATAGTAALAGDGFAGAGLGVEGPGAEAGAEIADDRSGAPGPSGGGGGVYFKQILDERCGCASYLIASRETGEAAVVDPALVTAEVETILRERGFVLRYAIDTHVHADHVSGARRLAAGHDAELCLFEAAEVAYPFRALRDGEELTLGQIRLRVVHTPGHRRELMSVLVTNAGRRDEPSMVLTGDCLLVGDVGRPDFGGGDAGAQFASVRRLLELPDWVGVFPGHFEGPCGAGMCGRPSTTIGFERRFNPLAGLDRSAFVARLTGAVPPRPLNTAAIEATNRGLVEMPWAMPTASPAVPEVGVEEIGERAAGALLLDVREPAEYATGHVPGAVNLPQAELANRLGELPRDRALLVICQAGARSLRAAQFLAQVGFTRVTNVRDGTGAWAAAGLPLEMPSGDGAPFASDGGRGGRTSAA